MLNAIGSIADFSNQAGQYAQDLASGKVKWEEIPPEFQADIRQYNPWAMRGKAY